jgi:GNAT superfamily N-acetyltransferase
MEVRELTSDAEIEAAFGLMAQLRDRIRSETFLEEVRLQETDGYRLIGGFDEEKLVALAGVRRSHTLARGLHAFVDDLVTEEGEQGNGYGTQLLRWIARHALEQGLPRLYLDARTSALSFYDRLGFHNLTSIPCWIDTAELANDEPPSGDESDR